MSIDRTAVPGTDFA